MGAAELKAAAIGGWRCALQPDKADARLFRGSRRKGREVRGGCGSHGHGPYFTLPRPRPYHTPPRVLLKERLGRSEVREGRGARRRRRGRRRRRAVEQGPTAEGIAALLRATAFAVNGHVHNPAKVACGNRSGLRGQGGTHKEAGVSRDPKMRESRPTSASPRTPPRSPA
jgi:hypothetical protein